MNKKFIQTATKKLKIQNKILKKKNVSYFTTTICKNLPSQQQQYHDLEEKKIVHNQRKNLDDFEFYQNRKEKFGSLRNSGLMRNENRDEYNEKLRIFIKRITYLVQNSKKSSLICVPV